MHDTSIGLGCKCYSTYRGGESLAEQRKSPIYPLNKGGGRWPEVGSKLQQCFSFAWGNSTTNLQPKPNADPKTDAAAKPAGRR
jgi:hypothetical protein